MILATRAIKKTRNELQIRSIVVVLYEMNMMMSPNTRHDHINRKEKKNGKNTKGLHIKTHYLHTYIFARQPIDESVREGNSADI